MLGTILLVILIMLLIGALPRWDLHDGGYAPAGIVGTVLVVILILMLLGKFPL